MSSPKIGAVILSRFGSSRLPGKALKEISGKPVLQYIVERLSCVLSKSSIVLATSKEKSDDVIEALCHELGISCFRGSLDNVADRFFQACQEKNWDYGIRVNGDNFFVDINTLSKMISIGKLNRYDFISNVKDRTFPKGMSIEIVRLSFYKSVLQKIITSSYHAEHVTSLLYETPDSDDFKVMHVYNTEYPEASGIQMAIDTPEDLERTKEIVSYFKDYHTNYNLPEIIEIINNLKKTV